MSEYLLKIVSEPEEPGIVLNQKEFETIYNAGLEKLNKENLIKNHAESTAKVSSENSETDFATLETLTDSPFLYEGKPVPEETVAKYFNKGLQAIIEETLTKLKNREET